MEVPIAHVNAERDHRPTDVNFARWLREEPYIRWYGAWQPKSVSFQLPAAVATIRGGDNTPCGYGGDATRTLREAELDRHISITCVFVCEHCGDVGLAIEVVDDEDHTLSFYRRGVSGDWTETHVPDEIADAFVLIRGTVMGLVPEAAAYVAQIEADRAPR